MTSDPLVHLGGSKCWVYSGALRVKPSLYPLVICAAMRAISIPDYRLRRREGRYIGSGHVEKTNDLRVAQRQKGQGMHWSLDTSDALAALRTLMLNGGWERYWRDRQVLPLVAA